MIAQITLIPTESKKLICRGIARLEMVKEAQEKGMVVIHPSSTTYFLVEELTGKPVDSKVWVCGLVIPKGTCTELEARKALHESQDFSREQFASDPELFPFTWVVKKGKLKLGMRLRSILAEMGPNDVYIKGANALDTDGNVAVLYGNLKSPGGTFGRVLVAMKQKGFKLILPTGLEKLIPIPVSAAAKKVTPKKLDFSMGSPCGMIPCKGTVVTEIDAIRLISGASAFPVAAGGLGGAEGAVTMILEGDKKQVTEALRHIKEVKGAQLPQVKEFGCSLCDRAGCSLAGQRVASSKTAS